MDEWRTQDDFDDELAYNAEVVTAMLYGMNSKIDRASVFDYIYEVLLEDGGFNPETAEEIGYAVATKAYLKRNGTLQ